MSAEPDLKPCPFCGGPAELMVLNDEDMAWISCTTCDVYVDWNKSDFTKQKAIDHWNTRV